MRGRALSKVLVTGGAGFIGSHLVDALVDQGHDVEVVDSLVPQVHAEPPSYLNSKARYLRHDVRNRPLLRNALRNAELIFHLAASVGVGQSMYQPSKYVAANTQATADLLQVLVDEKLSPERLVVASSMSLYGEGAYTCTRCGEVAPPLRGGEQLRAKRWEVRCPSCGAPATPHQTPETKPLAPTSVYAITKRDTEELCLVLGRAYGIPTVALRLFGVYGPRQSLSNPYTGVCAIFQSRILNGRPPLVYEDGMQTRDFVSVHDVVRAFVLAGERHEGVGQAINVGTGKPTSIREVAETLVELSGRNLPFELSGEFRAGDVRHCVADISLAGSALGYRPRVSLEEGLQELWEWSKTQRALDHVDRARGELLQHGLVRS